MKTSIRAPIILAALAAIAIGSLMTTQSSSAAQYQLIGGWYNEDGSVFFLEDGVLYMHVPSIDGIAWVRASWREATPGTVTGFLDGQFDFTSGSWVSIPPEPYSLAYSIFNDAVLYVTAPGTNSKFYRACR